MLAAPQPVCARPAPDAPALCGRTGVSPWTSRRSEVTCEGCRAEIDRRLVIRCDYCEAPARTFFPRGGPPQRSFACAAHEDRARRSLGTRPEDRSTDTPLPGRSRFESLGTTEVLERWRRHREAVTALEPGIPRSP